jgi:hypothetical protein
MTSNTQFIVSIGTRSFDREEVALLERSRES